MTSERNKVTVSRQKARKLFQTHYNVILDSKYHVHHKDENPLNNDIDNLDFLDAGDHARLHHKGKKVGCHPKVTLRAVDRLIRLWNASL